MIIQLIFGKTQAVSRMNNGNLSRKVDSSEKHFKIGYYSDGKKYTKDYEKKAKILWKK